MKGLFQNILVFVLIAGVIGAVFLWYSRRSAEQKPLPLQAGPTEESRVRFAALLRNLKTVQLDVSFFQDSVYQSLIDPSVKVTLPSEKGRANPFLPWEKR